MRKSWFLHATEGAGRTLFRRGGASHGDLHGGGEGNPFLAGGWANEEQYYGKGRMEPTSEGKWKKVHLAP